MEFLNALPIEMKCLILAGIVVAIALLFVTRRRS